MPKIGENIIHCVRASPTVLTMWLHILQCIAKTSKCAGLAQEIGFSAPNSCKLAWLVKGATPLWTSQQKECNKLHLTASQYFGFVDHNDWSKWFAIRSPPMYVQFPFQFYWRGRQKNTAKLRHFILLSRVTYWAPLKMLLQSYLQKPSCTNNI
jgi:hypothetical protein